MLRRSRTQREMLAERQKGAGGGFDRDERSWFGRS